MANTLMNQTTIDLDHAMNSIKEELLIDMSFMIEEENNDTRENKDNS